MCDLRTEIVLGKDTWRKKKETTAEAKEEEAVKEDEEQQEDEEEQKEQKEQDDKQEELEECSQPPLRRFDFDGLVTGSVLVRVLRCCEWQE
eukprot:s13330_g1.t1